MGTPRVKYVEDAEAVKEKMEEEDFEEG